MGWSSVYLCVFASWGLLELDPKGGPMNLPGELFSYNGMVTGIFARPPGVGFTTGLGDCPTRGPKQVEIHRYILVTFGHHNSQNMIYPLVI